MATYSYNGPVSTNGKAAGYFKAETEADSFEIALNNIRYRAAKNAMVNVRFVEVKAEYLHPVWKRKEVEYENTH